MRVLKTFSVNKPMSQSHKISMDCGKRSMIVLSCVSILILVGIRICLCNEKDEYQLPSCGSESDKPPCTVTLSIPDDEVKSIFDLSGYPLKEKQNAEKVICEPDNVYRSNNNGFYQTYYPSNQGNSRIIVFPKGNVLQMHYHDIYEEFVVEYGSFTLHLLDPKETFIMKSGDVLKIAAGRKHQLNADKDTGFSLREIVAPDSFTKRKTIFVSNLIE